MDNDSFIADSVDRFARLARTVAEVEEGRWKVLVNAIVQAYDRALDDPQVKMPTYLHAVMEVARKEASR